MRHFKALEALALLSMDFVGRGNGATTVCQSQSTVYVTALGSPVIETVYAASSGAQAGASSSGKNGMTAFETVPTTKIISVRQAFEDSANPQDTMLITVSGTNIITKTHASTPILPTSNGSHSRKLYSRHSTNGLNATTFDTKKAEPTRYQPNDRFVGASAHHPMARRVDNWVVATLDGKAVSWANNYEPSKSTAPSAGALSTLPVALPIYPWDLSPPSSNLVPTSSAPATATTLAMYPWDSLPAPSRTPTNSDLSSSVIATMSSSGVATAEPTSCGNSSALFTINFDDLPHFSISSTSRTQDIPPISNPYRKLHFDGHFGYVPPPSDPYPPHSSPQLAIYRASGTAADGSSHPGLEASGEIGAGAHVSDSSYWVDALSAYLGCSDGTSSPCSLTINGYIDSQNQPKVTQLVELPACPGLKNCSLTFVEFGHDMRGLSSFRINAAVGNKAIDYYMDDLKLGWSNDTCAAQSERSSIE